MWKLSARYSSFGIEIVIAFTLPTFLGNYLDKKLDTEPWLMIFGIIIGFGTIIKIITRLIKDHKV